MFEIEALTCELVDMIVISNYYYDAYEKSSVTKILI